METIRLKNNIPVFGIEVITYPENIGQTFDQLMKSVSNGSGRPYYGISYRREDGSISYFAMTEEKQPGEHTVSQYAQYIISKGVYLTFSIKNWKLKVDTIADVFNILMKDERIDKTAPCIEWYKTEEEMICMIKVKE